MRALLFLLALVSLPALAAGLNDTGIAFCGDEITNVADCATVAGNGGTYPRQDARYGRDAATTAGQVAKVGSGEAGFDFTALNASGQPTTPSSGANPHPCVRDNVTGLIWEVKTADDGLRDQKWTYSWYDSVHNYGGYSSYGSNCKTSGRCDTEKYVADVNAAALCGFSDWRMPTTNELQGIVHFGRTDPAIDPTFFPNTPSSIFWSGSPGVEWEGAWHVEFSGGQVSYVYYYNTYTPYRRDGHSVRLVRAGQSLSTVALTLSATGTGYGTLTGSPGSLNCTITAGVASGICSASPEIGSTVLLTASPATGSAFTGWSGACSGSSATCNLSNITAAKNVIATFTLNTYAITATANPLAGGSASCTPNPVGYGGSANCTATPNAGYTLSAWSGDCSGTTCNLSNVTTTKNVTAYFYPSILANQTITFGTAPSIAVGGTGTVSATGGGSGQPVTFSSLTTSICSVSNSTVTGVAAGTCTIAANQAGNASYNAAPQVTQDIAIGKVSQTIAFGAAPSMVVGGTGNVSATATSGLAVTFSSLTTSICTVSGSTVSGIAAGTCTIAANQSGNSTYNAATQVTQNIAIGKVSQNIAFGAAPSVVVVGTGNVSATATSGLAVAFSSLSTSICSVSGTAVTGISAGTCTIAANQSGNSTYNAAPQVTQDITIGKVSQTIAFGTAPSVVVGGTGTVSATGGGSGQPVTFSSLTTSICSVSGTAVNGIATGTCTIAANQAGNASYNAATQVTQNIAIGKASQTITFGAAPSVVVGGTGNVSATATSGLAVTFSSLTTSICTVSGSTVSGLTAGTCTIAGNQDGNASYNAAPQVTQSFSVVPAQTRYTKIANNGTALPDSAALGSGATQWACTRDNTSGLTWEVKTTDGGLRDWNKAYTNYDDPTQAQKWNGGSPINPTQAEIDGASNTIGLINAVNASALCGYHDWKRPSVDELYALVDTANAPTINLTFFPNTQKSYFWSGSPSADYARGSWAVDFYHGSVFYNLRDNANKVRLVRAGQ